MPQVKENLVQKYPIMIVWLEGHGVALVHLLCYFRKKGDGNKVEIPKGELVTGQSSLNCDIYLGNSR